MFTVPEPVSCESEAASCNTYMPAAANAACVLPPVGLLNVTGAGPLTSDHWKESAPPTGNPSSVIFPVRLIRLPGRVMEFWLAITLTVGAWFGAGGFTVTGTVTEL